MKDLANIANLKPWQTREITEKAVATLERAYTTTDTPEAAVRAAEAAQGHALTVYSIAQLINYHGSDGRISRRNRKQTAEILTPAKYCGGNIHPAHLDQLADALDW